MTDDGQMTRGRRSSPTGLCSDEEIARARTQLRSYLGGGIMVTETDGEIRFTTEASAEEMALRMAGSGSQVFMVAGAGFVLSLQSTIGFVSSRFAPDRCA